jgi:beta-glucosidase
MKKNTGLILLLVLVFSSCGKQEVAKNEKDHFIDSLLAEMTLDEKIGQTVLYTSDWTSTGPTIRDSYKEDIKAGKVGAVFNAITTKYVRDLQHIAVEETRLGIPLIFGFDVIHGHRTIFPVPLGETASWDLEAIEQGARVAAIEASAEGLNWTFAPMVDIARDPRWGRIMEGAGEDPYLGSLVARARVRGFQGDDLSAPNTILACVKHYAAYGAAQAGREYHSVDMSERMLRSVYLPPYYAAVDEGVATVMTSFNDLDGVPATGNKFLLKKILRDEWGFNGFVVTDYTSINEMVNHGNVADLKEAASLALNAGVDMDMQGAAFDDYLKVLLEDGKVTEEQINLSARRILEMKYNLGLFDDPYLYCDEQREKELIYHPDHLDEQREKELIYHPDHLKAARDMAKKSMVLLKNDNQVLPLSNKSEKLAVIGPLAFRYLKPSGKLQVTKILFTRGVVILIPLTVRTLEKLFMLLWLPIR